MKILAAFGYEKQRVVRSKNGTLTGVDKTKLLPQTPQPQLQTDLVGRPAVSLRHQLWPFRGKAADSEGERRVTRWSPAHAVAFCVRVLLLA